VVVEALAAGQLSPGSAAAWLAPRLSPGPAPRAWQALTGVPLPSLRLPRALSPAGLPAAARMLVSAVLTIAVGGIALLATACASGPATPAAHPARTAPAHARQQQTPVAPPRIVIAGTGRRR
jgi:hypothetical protein